MRGPWFDFERYAVWGLGRSGIAAANLLARHDKQVVASDPGKAERPASLDERVTFSNAPNAVGQAEVVVVSPGLKPSNEVFAEVAVPVISEIELGWASCATPFIGITGTDGKTTTTELTQHILAKCGLRAVAAGNIGIPLTEVSEAELDVIVAEVSAFQLWTTHQFHVEAAAVTNLAADHLDYFAGWEEYVAAKRLIFRNIGPDDWGIFNWDDPIVRSWTEDFEGRRALVSVKGRPDAEADMRMWLEPRTGVLWADRGTDSSLPFLSVAQLEAAGLRGLHNVSNVLTASALAVTRGIGVDAIATSIADFEVGGHRIEFVRELDRVGYFDDSKATNAHAALAGIRSLQGRLVVIAGGVDKGIELDALAGELTQRARSVVLIGEIRERFQEALLAAGFAAGDIRAAHSMSEAVAVARELAVPGDHVLLSPACSSFDMFSSYADRGDQFQAAVRSL